MTTADPIPAYRSAVERVLRGPAYGARMRALEAEAADAADEGAFREVVARLRALLDEVHAVVDAEWMAAGRRAPTRYGHA